MTDIPKFRAWIIGESRMADVLQLDFQDHYLKCVHQFDKNFAEIYLMRQVILMQSTGLSDKNGKLIFEGDIVKISFGEQRTKNDTFTHRATVQKIGLDWLAVRANTPHHHSRLGAYHNASFEILGSIHENKELLNV